MPSCTNNQNLILLNATKCRAIFSPAYGLKNFLPSVQNIFRSLVTRENRRRDTKCSDLNRLRKSLSKRPAAAKCGTEYTQPVPASECLLKTARTKAIHLAVKKTQRFLPAAFFQWPP